MSEQLRPGLSRQVESGGIAVHTDVSLAQRHGVRVAFSERSGGVSRPPFDSLNLASHVGDDPYAVDENRRRLLAAVGLGGCAPRLTTSAQVHGDRIVEVTEESAGRGALALGSRGPIADTDALWTSVPGTPLMMCFADCVPVVLVTLTPHPAVAVVHAGWRGARVSLPGSAVAALAGGIRCATDAILAYIGPHIGACCYEVGAEITSQFVARFGTIAAVDGRLDLSAVVTEDLVAAGVARDRIARVEDCTFDCSDRYYSYRTSRVTGRHGALAAIVKVD